MTGEFEVQPDDLVAHASHVDSLVERLHTAVSAADSAMSDHAYGLLCAFLPPIINPTGQQAKDTVSAAGDGVHQMADNVRTAAQSYRDGEQGNAEPFQRQVTAEPRGGGPAQSKVMTFERASAPDTARYREAGVQQ